MMERNKTGTDGRERKKMYMSSLWVTWWSLTTCGGSRAAEGGWCKSRSRHFLFRRKLQSGLTDGTLMSGDERRQGSDGAAANQWGASLWDRETEFTSLCTCRSLQSSHLESPSIHPSTHLQQHHLQEPFPGVNSELNYFKQQIPKCFLFHLIIICSSSLKKEQKLEFKDQNLEYQVWAPTSPSGQNSSPVFNHHRPIIFLSPLGETEVNYFL